MFSDFWVYINISAELRLFNHISHPIAIGVKIMGLAKQLGSDLKLSELELRLELQYRSLKWSEAYETGVKVDNPDSKVHGANMGSIWGRQDPGGPHAGPMNFAIWEPIVKMELETLTKQL